MLQNLTDLSIFLAVWIKGWFLNLIVWCFTSFMLLTDLSLQITGQGIKRLMLNREVFICFKLNGEVSVNQDLCLTFFGFFSPILILVCYLWWLGIRFPVLRVPSIRENQGKYFPSGKSGNFVESHGKSGNFALTKVNQISTLIQMDFFLKPYVTKCHLAALGIFK